MNLILWMFCTKYCYSFEFYWKFLCFPRIRNSIKNFISSWWPVRKFYNMALNHSINSNVLQVTQHQNCSSHSRSKPCSKKLQQTLNRNVASKNSMYRRLLVRSVLPSEWWVYIWIFNLCHFIRNTLYITQLFTEWIKHLLFSSNTATSEKLEFPDFFSNDRGLCCRENIVN